MYFPTQDSEAIKSQRVPTGPNGSQNAKELHSWWTRKAPKAWLSWLVQATGRAALAPRQSQEGPNAPKAWPSWPLQATRQAALAPESHSRWVPSWSQGGPNAPKALPSWHLQATVQATLAPECHSRWAPRGSQGGPKGVPTLQRHGPRGLYTRQGKQPWPQSATRNGSQAGPPSLSQGGPSTPNIFPSVAFTS